MKRTAYPLLLLAVALPLVLTGCARSGEMMNDGDMTLADGAVIPVPVEAGTEEAMELLGATTSPSNTIVENALAIPNLSNLVEAVQAAGLVETLNGPGDFTVFAPINAAFDRADLDEFSSTMSEDEMSNLQMLLKSHVADGATMFGSLNEGMMVVMLSGEEFPVGRDENDLMSKRIGNADFIVYDVESSNGVIHLINLVLNPDGF
jgi:uncharacterized surface protein with fasciclin (FAS1) repeats